ncbi:MAG TPA: hypothetical protein VFW38_04810 [Solirubrobacteraceae bacterium]|nr:hypothetical protein [Solirubrobacteraceae bacterium]
MQLQPALTAFLEQAATRLHADVLAGSDVPFDVETRSSARLSADRRSGRVPRTGHRSTTGAALYCYRPLTERFIAERFAELRRLDAYGPAREQLEQCDTLERYLLARGVEAPPRGERHADAVLLALLQDVFDEQTDFDPSRLAQHPERLEHALERLDGSALPRAGEVTLVATLHGLAISSPQIVLARGLSLAQPDALSGAPEQALRVSRAEERGHLLVVYTSTDSPSGAEGVAEGVAVMQELLRTLRLFGDGRIALGTRAFARVGDGQWSTIALGAGGHPHGVLLVTAEQEDELRAFCALVSRRMPEQGPVAWALRRFELGCDRASEFEGLSDHLLALRALLVAPSEVEPEGAADGLLAGRLAALCAVPERRAELAERTLAAIALEREAIAGTAVERAGRLAVARDLADHLRALLRDVVCGHLQPRLAELADRILLGEPERGPQPRDAAEEQLDGQLSLTEQQLGDERDPADVLRVAV